LDNAVRSVFKGFDMLIVATQMYPTEQSKEMAKRYAEMPPVPSFLTKRGPYFTSELGTGIKTITLYDFDPAKTAEALAVVGARFARYHGVPGCTYSIGLWSEVSEALKMIGLA
jgi:hypothetical protein